MTHTRTDTLNRAAVAAVSVALIVAIAISSWNLTQSHRADHRREAAISVARAQVLDLTTLDSSSIAAKVKSMGARVTGDFKRQFDGFAKTFVSAVSQQKIKATGTIKAAALSSYAEDAATVIVAASAQVSTGGKATVTPRDYRLKVSLSRIGSRWLISGMEFVQ